MSKQQSNLALQIPTSAGHLLLKYILLFGFIKSRYHCFSLCMSASSLCLNSDADGNA